MIRLNQFQLKIIAITTMIIDHIGLFLLPQYVILHVIGRLSFPIFAWLIANGAYHTRNINRYLLRLVALAFISQIPYALARRLIDADFFKLNIFFTLSLGLAAIILIKKTQSKLLWLFITAFLALFASLINTDYGALGVFAIVAFYLFYNSFILMLLSQMAIWFVSQLDPALVLNGVLYSSNRQFAVLAVFVIALYNHKQGLKFGYWFYLIYPLHYLVFYAILRF
jgi:hypothetical protein